MKTIVETSTGVSVYLFNDENSPEITAEHVVFNGEVVDTQLNSSNANLVENIAAPDDWIGRKYILNNGEWTQNPNDPTLPH
jgi:hypothetical protein